jgi:hypothetical protein
MVRSRLVRAALAASVLFLCSSSLQAELIDTVRDRGLVGKLRAAKAGQQFQIEGVPVGGDALGTLELTPVKVWADDAKVVVYGANGIDRIEGPPATRYFRGRVAGSTQSGVSISLYPDGTVNGLILNGSHRLKLGTGRRIRETRGRQQDPNATPVLVSEIGSLEDLTEAAAEWSCQTDAHPELSAGLDQPRQERRLQPRTEAGNVAGASYTLELAFETDDELFAVFGSVSAVENYIADLVAGANIMYERDINTTLLVGHINVRSGGTGSDPWTVLPPVPPAASTTLNALKEFGTVWNTDHPFVPTAGKVDVQRASAIFVSGKIFNGGVAWVNVIGVNNFATTGGIGGAYAFLGSAGSVTNTVPDPTLVVNGVEFGVGPSNSVAFWMLLQFAHEFGHNANGPHTHCVALTGAEQTLYGVPGRAFVDICHSGDSDFVLGTCYAGPTAVPTEQGTVMSYCHNDFVAGFRQSRYLMGVEGEPSEKMLVFLRTGLENGTPNATMTTQAAPVACSSGRTASVTNCANCAFSWSIDGGTITSSSTVAAITYTPTEESVTLTVSITNTQKGATITASKTVATSCVAATPIAAPTNVQALATGTSAVFVSWSGSDGATRYTVWRATGGGAFAPLAEPNPPAATSYLDESASAGTSYLYKVQAHNASTDSALSGADFAMTVVYTDPTVTSGMSVKALHLTELRTAANQLHALTGAIDVPAYTDPTITAGSTAIKALHFLEVETVLRDALGSLGATVPAALGIAGGGAILPTHVNTLRTYGQ